jgi:8-oxo-dGTP pyrophosphatase MutT (NUDIX family)
MPTSTYNPDMLSSHIVDRAAARLAQALARPRTALVPFVVDGCDAGYLDARRAERLAGFREVFDVRTGAVAFRPTLSSAAARTAALDAVARTLAAEGALTRWREERYSVAATPHGATLFEIERAAARYFGIATQAAHVNATTTRDGELGMWIARRSATKSIDPGQLDNLVGGGVAAGVSIAETVLKEAREEAGIPNELAMRAERQGAVRIFREQPDGIHRETLHVHDLTLPPGFTPRNEDGEVADYRLASIEAIAGWIGDADGDDVVTADASLVIVDWLIRRGFVQPAHAAFETLDRLRGV